MEGGIDSEDLIPGLPDDLALLCFGWLPRRLHPLASCVSRAWKGAFQSQALLSVRRQLGTIETWLLLCLQGHNRDAHVMFTYTYSWWAIDPALCLRCEPIALPPFPPVKLRDYDVIATTIGQGEVVLAARAHLDPHTAITIPMTELCFLDASGTRWLGRSPSDMLMRRVSFASASLNGHVYVAGGECSNGGNIWHNIFSESPLKSVERLDCRTMSLGERLPDMHVARSRAGGVVLNGCFYVIGGYNKAGTAFSGEIWDPESQKWIFAPELWPYHIFKECSVAAGQCVAVMMGTLVAIKQVWEGKRELMLFDNATKIWMSLGCIPIESFCHNSNLANKFLCKPFGVGKELWVAVHGVCIVDMFMIACSPLSGQPISWRRLPYSFNAFDLDVGVAVDV